MNKNIDFLQVAYIPGPNIWTYSAVIEAWIDIGEFEDLPSNQLEGFNHRLVEMLPGLEEHRCSIGERGGFIQRLEQGTWIGHILEHVAIELQCSIGIAYGFGQTREVKNERGIYKLAFKTPDEQIGRQALYAARELVLSAVHNKPFAVAKTIEQLNHLMHSLAPKSEVTHLLDACTNKKIPWIKQPGKDLIQLGYGRQQRKLWSSIPDKSGAIAIDIAANDKLSRALLHQIGLPVIQRLTVSSPEHAWESARLIGLPVSIKTEEHQDYYQVCTNLVDQEAVICAFQTIDAAKGTVLIENYLKGTKYRFYVIHYKVIAIAAELPIYAVIDGSSAPPDATLNQSNRKELLNQMHSSIKKIAELACRTINLNYAAIDIVIEDIHQDANAQNLAIYQINSSLELLPHTKADGALLQTLSETIAESLFPESSLARIPIIGITGTEDTSFLAQLITYFLQAAGYQHIGLASQSSVFIGSRCITQQKNINREQAQQVLMHPLVEVAVIENNTKTILTEGLAYDRCAVGIVTDFSLDEKLQDFYIADNDALFKVLRTQIDVVLPNGAGILNAASPDLLKMAVLCDGDVIFYADEPYLNQIRSYREQGKTCVFIQNKQIIVAQDHQEYLFMALDQLNTVLSAHYESMLAAIATMISLHISLDVISNAVLQFENNLITS